MAQAKGVAARREMGAENAFFSALRRVGRGKWRGGRELGSHGKHEYDKKLTPK